MRHFGSNLRKQFVWWLMQPAWKSFSPSPPPAWWPSWQSRTSLWQAWDAPSQRWNSLVVQRSRVSWQHQAPSKRVAKNWGKGKVGTCWSRSKRTSSSGTFLLPSFAQAITLLGWTCNNHTIYLRKFTLYPEKIHFELEPVLLPLASGQKGYCQQTPGLRLH